MANIIVKHTKLRCRMLKCVVSLTFTNSFSYLSHTIILWKCLYQVRVITFFPVFRLLTDFVCLYTYEFWLSLWKIVRSSIILLLPLSTHSAAMILTNFVHIPVSVVLLVRYIYLYGLSCSVYRNVDFELNAFCLLNPS